MPWWKIRNNKGFSLNNIVSAYSRYANIVKDHLINITFILSWLKTTDVLLRTVLTVKTVDTIVSSSHGTTQEWTADDSLSSIFTVKNGRYACKLVTVQYGRNLYINFPKVTNSWYIDLQYSTVGNGRLENIYYGTVNNGWLFIEYFLTL